MRITDIAEMANTSVATVSRVLNNSDKVSEKTRQKVLAVIQKTGYKPNLVASSLRKNESRKLLIMVGTVSNPFYSDFISGFDETARKKGYGVLLAVTHRNPEIEQEYFDLLHTNQVDGVASFIPTSSSEIINQVAENHPFVACCFRGTDRYHTNYVCIDNEQAAYDMTKYLLSLGHTCIAALNGDLSRVYEKERAAGYRRALEEAGLPYRKEYDLLCQYDFRSAYVKAGELLAMPEPPTAIFAMSDDRAAGVVKYLVEHGLVPGVDLDVAGFDGIGICEVMTPSITTVIQPREEIGRAAVELLLEQIADKNAQKKGIIMAHRLEIRDSTRKAPLPIPS